VFDPSTLFVTEGVIDPREINATTLLVTLEGMIDAGHTQSLLNSTLLTTLDQTVIGHFDADQVVAYVVDRPHVLIDRGRLEDLNVPEITLHLLSDTTGRQFLLLSGPEPAVQWERMSVAIQQVVERFGIDLTLVLRGVPAPVPHTRPVFVAHLASEPEELQGAQVVPGTFRVSASFTDLLQIRLGAKGHRAVALVAHVPQYLAENDFPDAVLTLLDGVRTISGLDLPTGALEAASERIRDAVDQQVDQSAQIQAVVAQLEAQYDSYLLERERSGADVSHLPTADEIGREVEDFLAALGGKAVDPGSRRGRGTTAADDSPERTAPPEESSTSPQDASASPQEDSTSPQQDSASPQQDSPSPETDEDGGPAAPEHPGTGPEGPPER
jgi:hypothetical protein